MFDNPIVTVLFQEIKPQLQETLVPYGGLGKVTTLGKPKPVADDTTKLLIHNQQGQPVAVLLCSSPVSPQAIAHSMSQAEQARLRLPAKLGEVIPTPLMSGECDGLTFAVLPYFKPLSQSNLRLRWQCWHLRPRVLAWLREVTQVTLHTPSSSELKTDFIMPLERMLSYAFQPPIREAITTTLERLNSGQWTPRYVLAHNDLWEGNLLLHSGKHHLGFMVIDWGSANVKGQAIYDLLRIANSLRLGRKALLEELQQHCRILDCPMADTQAHLLTSFGYLGGHLGCFPQERYIILVETFYRLLHETLREHLR
ncbi:MAG: hypothetical protein BWK79_15120 [Beggiatoa sp. IS2]|nr:MAG: hypothetical protein BWK79_15120 [Beggiatoa sp. IS2]